MHPRAPRTSISLMPSLLLLTGLCAAYLAGAGCGGGSSGTPTGTGGKGAAGTSGAGTAGKGAAGTSGAGTTGAAGSTTGAGGTAGVTSTGGGGGVAAAAGTSGGAGQSAAGTSGTVPKDGGAGTTATGTGGAPGDAGGGKVAHATLSQANGNGFMGTATFTQDAAGIITLTLMIKNCGNSAHAFHIGMNPDCGNDGMNAGAHWVPNGDGLGEVTCAGGGGGMGMTTYKTPSAGYWTIGTGDPASDILLRALVVDQGPATKPGNPMGCGVPRVD
jgi:hypothetical protein